MAMTATVTFRTTPEKKARIEELAKRTKRSAGFYYNVLLEDYLDELDMREMYPELESACRKLLTLFEWKEEYPSEIRFLLASALGNQGKPEEALKYCENWEAEETGNPLAAAALIYAKIKMKDLEGAEEVVKRYIAEDTVCTEENDVIFTAALRLYKENGNKEMEKKMDDILEEYDKKLSEQLH